MRTRVTLLLAFVACAPFANGTVPAGGGDDDDDDVDAGEKPRDAGPSTEVEADVGVLSRSQAYAKLVRDANPVGYWRCDEAPGATEAKDEVGANPAAFADAGAPLILPGQGLFGGGACEFGGVDTEKAVAMGLPLQTPNFSLEIWFRSLRVLDGELRHLFFQATGPGNTDQGYGIFIRRDDEGRGVHSEYWVGGDNGHHLVHASPLNINAWHHVVATSGDGLWIDGSKSADIQIAGGTPSYAQPLTFGNKGGATDHSVVGLISDVAVYGYALTPEQIAAHYSAGKP